jgi:hypothetical protein
VIAALGPLFPCCIPCVFVPYLLAVFLLPTPGHGPPGFGRGVAGRHACRPAVSFKPFNGSSLLLPLAVVCDSHSSASFLDFSNYKRPNTSFSPALLNSCFLLPFVKFKLPAMAPGKKSKLKGKGNKKGVAALKLKGKLDFSADAMNKGPKPKPAPRAPLVTLSNAADMISPQVQDQAAQARSAHVQVPPIVPAPPCDPAPLPPRVTIEDCMADEVTVVIPIELYETLPTVISEPDPEKKAFLFYNADLHLSYNDIRTSVFGRLEDCCTELEITLKDSHVTLSTPIEFENDPSRLKVVLECDDIRLV